VRGAAARAPAAPLRAGERPARRAAVAVLALAVVQVHGRRVQRLGAAAAPAQLTLGGEAVARSPGAAVLAVARRPRKPRAHLGPYPIVASRHSSTTSYQVSYHIR
jgi:hypothetical protein